MSSYLPGHRLIRAVRVLPEVVKIGIAPEESPSSSDVVEVDANVSIPEKRVSDELHEDLERWRRRADSAEARLADLQMRSSALEEELAAKNREVETEKKRLKDLMEEEISAAREKAVAEGRSEGLEQGSREGEASARSEMQAEYEARFSGVCSLIEEVHSTLQKELESLMSANLSRLVRLWQKVLSRLLLREVEVDEDSTIRILKYLLDRASEKDRIRIFLNPEDIDAVRKRNAELSDVLRGVRHVEFTPDEQVDRGSCIVETGLGVYDARWRTQLEQIDMEVTKILIEGLDDGEEKN